MGGCLLRTISCLLLSFVFGTIAYIEIGNYSQYTVDVEKARVNFEPAPKVRALEHDKEQAERIATVSIIGTLLFSALTLWFGVWGAFRYSRDHSQAKYEIEERRHQELLAATRQANIPRPPTPEPQLNSSMDNPNYQYILKAEKLYRAGKLDEAIEMLKLSNSPKAKKVLKNLLEIQKSKK